MGDNSEIQQLRVDNITGPLVGKRCKTKFCVAYGLGTEEEMAKAKKKCMQEVAKIFF